MRPAHHCRKPQTAAADFARRHRQPRQTPLRSQVEASQRCDCGRERSHPNLYGRRPALHASAREAVTRPSRCASPPRSAPTRSRRTHLPRRHAHPIRARRHLRSGRPPRRLARTAPAGWPRAPTPRRRWSGAVASRRRCEWPDQPALCRRSRGSDPAGAARTGRCGVRRAEARAAGAVSVGAMCDGGWRPSTFPTNQDAAVPAGVSDEGRPVLSFPLDDRSRP